MNLLFDLFGGSSCTAEAREIFFVSKSKHITSMANTTYAEKLKDPRWQKKRLEILQRDNFTCQYCGETTKTLHVHHLAYNKNGDPWDVYDEALETVCEECHLICEYKGFTDLEKRLIITLQYSGSLYLRPAREIAKDILLKYIKESNG